MSCYVWGRLCLYCLSNCRPLHQFYRAKKNSTQDHTGIAAGNIRKEKEGRRVVILALNRGNQLQSADGEHLCPSLAAWGDTALPSPLPYYIRESKSNSWWLSRQQEWSNTSQDVPISRHSCMCIARLLPLQRKSNGTCSFLTGLVLHISLSTLFDLQSIDCISLQNNEGTCWGATKHTGAGWENSTAPGSL